MRLAEHDRGEIIRGTYQALDTAVDDELIRRNPCRIKGAGRYDVPERPILNVTEVYAVADAIRSHHRVLVLLAASPRAPAS
ncbi:hypothetical protein DEJ45_16360 [Streptomyces venezuelae]|uniref:hypothetical protein n=1 Tax=Streptomyces venezuelae TaxID=54571 RepID=UPI00123DB679|nr:hypothetical protein [Streptomyces venezuelae]QES13837.1 hypothetical protein DEJ45_16360 [Streptomyces venezuelae]